MSQAQANDTRQPIASDTVVTMPSDHQIVTERVFDAPREWVFAAFSDPDLIPEWWGPRRLRTVVERMDVRSGGGWRFACHDSKGPVETFRGTYGEVIPPERIAQTFEWEGMQGHLVVETTTFENLDGCTKVRTTSGFPTHEQRDRMLASGMVSDSYERLDELLVSLGFGW